MAGFMNKGRPAGGRGQGAGMVQFGGGVVRNVENGDGSLGREGLLLEVGLGRDHLLVEDTDDANAAGHGAIEHHMPTDLKPAQTRLNRIAGPAYRRMLSEKVKAIFQLVQVAARLPPTPGVL